MSKDEYEYSLDIEVKEQAQRVFNHWGWMTTAINIFLRQAIQYPGHLLMLR